MTQRLAVLPARTLPGGLQLAVASTFPSRLRGLAGLRALPADLGLELPRCRSVHTVGMRFALDLLWMDGGGAILRVDRDVRPQRMRSCRHARSVIEVAAGRGDAFAAALRGPATAAR